jgi:hypothetical protein
METGCLALKADNGGLDAICSCSLERCHEFRFRSGARKSEASGSEFGVDNPQLKARSELNR